MSTINSPLIIKSSAFNHNEFIPSKYTCDGLNINPEILIDNIPANTKTLAIIVNDPDAPNGPFCHWVIWNIPPINNIKEDSAFGIQGKNSLGKNNYSGPCPPSGTHHYHYKVYALDIELNHLPTSTDEKKFMRAIQTNIISSGELVGLYKR